MGRLHEGAWELEAMADQLGAAALPPGTAIPAGAGAVSPARAAKVQELVFWRQARGYSPRWRDGACMTGFPRSQPATAPCPKGRCCPLPPQPSSERGSGRTPARGQLTALSASSRPRRQSALPRRRTTCAPGRCSRCRGPRRWKRRSLPRGTGPCATRGSDPSRARPPARSRYACRIQPTWPAS